MKMKGLKIETMLQLGLGAVFLVVLFLGAMTWQQTESLWQETKGLYEHPHTVRLAIGDLKADILAMQRDMRDLVLVADEQERRPILQGIDSHADDASRQFAVLYDRYLGPRSEIDSAHAAFVQWRALREETLRLVREGKNAEAGEHVVPGGLHRQHVDRMLSQVQKLSDFAQARGEHFYRDAESQKNLLMLRLWIVLGVIFALLLSFGYLLLRAIRHPLQQLTDAANQYRDGKLDVRCSYTRRNEFGVLAASFNGLAETVQGELASRETAARLAEVLLREEELHSFCRELLKSLMEHTGSQVGAVYLLNAQKTDFEHFESIGLTAGSRATFSVSDREGEFGVAIATQKIQRISDIPPDARLTFPAVSGVFVPREIITIPVVSGKDVVVVISLAGVCAYTRPAIRFIDDTWSVLTARVNGVLAFRQIREFSEKLSAQNQELEAQKRELTAQADELGEQNIELSMQKKQLDESNRLKSAFLSNMSHELRTPLNSVIALSSVLSRRLKGAIAEAEYGYLEVIERNGKNLLALINDILDLSRIEAGREEVSPVSFGVRTLVAEVVATIEPQAREKSIALENTVPHDLAPLTSDIDKCRHILQNLVGNAVKFTEKGSVHVSARMVDTAVLIEVTDTGIGIAPDKLGIIFDEFRQADDGTSRKYGGTGLGLSIAGKHAHLLQGSVEVRSSLGHGSTFTLRLPLAPAGLGSADVVHAGQPARSHDTGVRLAPGSGSGKCILLVEDSGPAVIQMTDILTEQGYRVIVARNGKEALEQIGRVAPDAMILDLMMPEVDGFQVLKAIRDREETKRLPVLILTAKHVTKEELSFLTGNHIHQLIRKGDVGRNDLLVVVDRMVFPRSPETPRIPSIGSARRLRDGKPVVLVVEDNPDNMTTARAVLQDVCTVIEAADGHSGVELARKHKPDLVLMDISLPIMDGIKALRAIKDDEALRHIPVIALTASAMKGSREEILAHGFDGYVSKPINATLLHDTIREAIGG